MNLDAIMSADSDAQKGQDDYKAASTAWKEYRAASDEILKLSREGKQQEACLLYTSRLDCWHQLQEMSKHILIRA